MTELKPCPFCGGKARLHTAKRGRSAIGAPYWSGYVVCRSKKCGVQTPMVKSPDAATAAWNKRTCSKDQEVLEKAYALGFGYSGEGYNAEYPFGDHAIDFKTDARWIASRDTELATLKGKG